MTRRRKILPTRKILAIGLAGLGLAGAGGLQAWTVETPEAARLVGRELAAYGLRMAADGPAAVRLLPLPRLSFDRPRLTDAATGAVLAEEGRLTVVLDPAALLRGRIGVGSLALDGARVRLPENAEDPRWREPLRRLSERALRGPLAHPRRIVLSRLRLDGGGREIRDLDLDLTWPVWSAVLEGQASLTWQGERARIVLRGLRPGDLAAGLASPFQATATWPDGSLSLSGTAVVAETLALDGQVQLATRSLPRTLAWIGRPVALAPLVEAFTLDGGFASAGGSVTVPRLRVGFAGSVLDGAGSAVLDGPRMAVQATLASENLNLAPVAAVLLRALHAEPADPVPAALGPLLGSDLDLRLSAAAGRVGPILVADLAASLLVRERGVELALNRASLQGGTVKGRVLLAATGQDGAETELRAAGTFDRVDLGGLLADLGTERWLAGPGQGQVTLESTGRDLAGLVAGLAGKAAVSMERGTLTGLDLADVIQRNGAVAAGALARRNGRTPFERAGLTLRFLDGIGDITGANLQAGGLTASLRGQLSLPDRHLRARAEVSPRGPAARPGPTFEIAGPWEDLAVRVNLRAGEAPPERALPSAARAYAP